MYAMGEAYARSDSPMETKRPVTETGAAACSRWTSYEWSIVVSSDVPPGLLQRQRLLNACLPFDGVRAPLLSPLPAPTTAFEKQHAQNHAFVCAHPEVRKA